MDKTESKEEILSGYQLIPLDEITPEARRIAVLWVEGFEPDGGIDIRQKHKLASDIMNYSNQQSAEKDERIEEAEELIKRLQDIYLYQIDQDGETVVPIHSIIKTWEQVKSFLNK